MVIEVYYLIFKYKINYFIIHELKKKIIITYIQKIIHFYYLYFLIPNFVQKVSYVI
jgi:hypothetical protein